MMFKVNKELSFYACTTAKKHLFTCMTSLVVHRPAGYACVVLVKVKSNVVR